jgi:hypothetical protein
MALILTRAEPRSESQQFPLQTSALKGTQFWIRRHILVVMHSIQPAGLLAGRSSVIITSVVPGGLRVEHIHTDQQKKY